MSFNILEDLNIVDGTFIDSTTFKDTKGNIVPLTKVDLRALAMADIDDGETKSANDFEDYDDSDTWFTPEEIDEYEQEEDGLNRADRGGDFSGGTKWKQPKSNPIHIIDDETGRMYTYDEEGNLEEI